ncbi:hypothetical protein ACHQM5_014912 [Ranunculus cassubicifolius]
MGNGIRHTPRCSAVFLLTMLVFLCADYQYALAVWSWQKYETDVGVENWISENVDLYVHCKSADNDLGPHVLAYKDYTHWEFVVNFFNTTKFWCTMSWVDSDGQEYYGSGDVYNRGQVKHCQDKFWCKRYARKDGVYSDDSEGSYLLFPWSKK